MVIVPQEVMEKLTNKNDNTTEKSGIKRQTDEFRTELDRILKKDSLTPEEAYKSYMQLFSKYINLEKESNSPPTVIFKPEILTEISETIITKPENTANDIWLNEKILLNIPKNKRPTARAMIEFIKDNQVVDTNKKGEIVIENNVTKNSHIIDLIHDFSRERNKKLLPVGFKEFAHALKKSNMPKEYVGNSIRRNMIFDSDSDSKTQLTKASSFDNFASAVEGDFDDTVVFHDAQSTSRRKHSDEDSWTKLKKNKREPLKREASKREIFSSKPRQTPLKYMCYDG